ncbi:hypothetical protein [Tateyamaria sp. Alg231-49]|uniref:hypothetical protein n=1 Tax=Tateyamaria sp. Alg231-49 TaxID=1922219 RepID=UPI00131F451D|nr:hypothetical protein [Tateyamaria sp. Alg231-49]
MTIRAGLLTALLFLSTSLAAGPVEDEIERLSTTFSGGDDVLFADAKLDTAVLIPQFYANRDYVLGWYGSANVDQLFAELNRGLEQGFRPTDFNLPLLYECPSSGFLEPMAA